jgi:hypothetical protein
MYGCRESAIRDRAKRYGWTKDLSEQVNRATRAKLLRSELRTHDPCADAQIIDEGSTLRASVVLAHRKEIRDTRALVAQMKAELREVCENPDDIEQAIEEETAEDRNPKRRERMLRAVGLPQRMSTLVNLTVAEKNVIALERQAFSLDENPSDQTAPQMLDITPARYEEVARRVPRACVLRSRLRPRL